MEPQIQAVDPSTLNRQDINLASYVAITKDNMRIVRATMVAAKQSLDALETKASGLADANDDLYQMFGTEAVQMYPELQGQDIRPLMRQLSSSHPLMQLWSQYDQKITAQIQSMQDLLNEADKQVSIINNGQATIDSWMSDYYGVWYKHQGLMPTVEDLYKSLDQMESIPVVDEGNVKIELWDIEKINPEAAAIVTLQAAQTNDLVDEERIENFEDPSGNPEVSTFQNVDLNRSVAPSVQSADSGFDFKNPKWLLGALALAYVVLGGQA